MLVQEVRAFDDITCARFSSGTLRCWGEEGGNGDPEQKLGDDEPVSAVSDLPLPEPVVGVEGSNTTTCAILASGMLSCWGNPRLAAPGEGLEDDVLVGERVLDVGGVVRKLSIQGSTACAVLDGGAVRCWGSNARGVLGYEGLTHELRLDIHPADHGDLPLAGPARDVVAEGQYTCVVLESGDVHCWGRNLWGGMGNPEAVDGGDSGTAADPFVVQLDEPAVAIDADLFHTCVLLESGAVRCWGFGDSGQLGLGDVFSVGDDEHPIEFPPVEVGDIADALDVGAASSCVRLSGGDMRCWGSNLSGVLGLGGAGSCRGDDGVGRCRVATSCCIGDDELPVTASAVPLPAAVEQLSVGSFHACALLEDDSVRCWGDNYEGQLGLGHTQTIGKANTAAEAPALVFDP